MIVCVNAPMLSNVLFDFLGEGSGVRSGGEMLQQPVT